MLCCWHAGEEADVLARISPCMGGLDGILVAGGCAVTATDSAADQHGHTCAHVLLLLHVFHQAAAQMEEAGHAVPDRPICVQVIHALMIPCNPWQDCWDWMSCIPMCSAAAQVKCVFGWHAVWVLQRFCECLYELCHA